MRMPRLLAVLMVIAIASSTSQIIVQAAAIPSSVTTSTVFILGVADDGSQIGRASGVIISSKGDIATNRHVVEDAFGNSTQKLLVVPTGKDEALNWKCAWTPSKYIPSDTFDLAVLLAPSKLPCAVTHLTPVSDLAPTGTSIHVLGYPAVGTSFINNINMTLTTLSGEISGPVLQNGVVVEQKTDAKIHTGNSGGPVIDQNNRLVGIVSAVTTAADVGEEVLGLFVPAMYISALLPSSSRAGQAATSGPLPSDVDSSAWFSSAIAEFVSSGFIQTNVPFRPGDMATRSEFIDLLVKAKGGANGQYQSQSFTDVPMTSPYFAAFEESGLNGWVHGTNDCYGKKPCYAKPNDRVNRAEAAALLNRAFGVSKLGQAPNFNDNPENAWYHEDIQTAADNCVLKGDSGGGTVRPGDFMNRAEMVAMISRITKGQTYGSGCGESTNTNRNTSRKSLNQPTSNVEIINDPTKNPINTCKDMNAIYNSNTGKCACAVGTTWNKAVTMCVSHDARCQEMDRNAEWDPVRETCQCGNGTEPSDDAKSCIPTCSSTYGYASYRTSTGQCTCLAGYFLKNGQCQMQPYCGGGTFNSTSGTCNCSNGYYEKSDGSCGVTPFCGDGQFDSTTVSCRCYEGATMKAGGYCSKY